MIGLAGVEAFTSRFSVSRETLDKLALFSDMISRENLMQNLVSVNTLPDFWHRHVLDSAQLVALAPRSAVLWLDVGSGAGLPGIVTSVLTEAKHMLVEPRRRRAEFLASAVTALDLTSRVEVIHGKVENVVIEAPVVITARAFASLSRTLAATIHLGGNRTTWLLHKGRSAASEIVEALASWSGDFEAIASITDSQAAIVRVRDVTRRANS